MQSKDTVDESTYKYTCIKFTIQQSFKNEICSIEKVFPMITVFRAWSTLFIWFPFTPLLLVLTLLPAVSSLVKKCAALDKPDIRLVLSLGHRSLLVNRVVVAGFLLGVFLWIKMKITENVDLRFSPVLRNGGNHRIPGDAVRVSLDQLPAEYTVDEVLYSTPKVVV